MTLTQLRNLGFTDIFHLESCIRNAHTNATTEWEKIFTQRVLEDYQQNGLRVRINRRTATLLLNLGATNEN
jgi:hypothetical protein